MIEPTEAWNAFDDFIMWLGTLTEEQFELLVNTEQLDSETWADFRKVNV